MSLLSALFQSGPQLDTALQSRIARWRSLPEPHSGTRLEEARFVVLDVETTGLDIHKCDLLSVGLVPASLRGIDLGGLTEILVRKEHTRIDKNNLVVHGITPTESAGGIDTEEALISMLELVGRSWLIAFHADFDRNVLARVLRKHLGVKFQNTFLDMAWLLPALFPDSTRGLRALDDWLGHFHIPAPARHRASADALVTAELLLKALAEARRQGHGTIGKLLELARTQSKLDRFNAH
jgi:DNA polymerase III subunit epsilon